MRKKDIFEFTVSFIECDGFRSLSVGFCGAVIDITARRKDWNKELFSAYLDGPVKEVRTPIGHISLDTDWVSEFFQDRLTEGEL